MARSSLLGIERSNPSAPGHDDAALGPSDSSDSGSDMAGVEAPDVADPLLPLDRALGDDVVRPLGAGDARGGASDTAGTGERRSAAGDDGGREAGDIGVDRVFSPFDAEGEAPLPDDVEASLEQSAVDPGGETEDDDELEGTDEIEEDESADPVGDGRADALLAASLPPRPGRPNPEPDPADDAPPGSPDGDPPGEGDEGPHEPGRDPGLRRRS